MNDRASAWRAFWRFLLLAGLVALVAVWVETQLDERTGSMLLPIGQVLRASGWALLYPVAALLLTAIVLSRRAHGAASRAWRVLYFIAQLGFVFLCVIVGELVWDDMFLPLYRTLGLFRYAHLFVPCLFLAAMFLIVSGAVFWRWAGVQWFVFRLIRLYLRFDPGGLLYYRIRHVWYRLRRRQSPSPRFVGVLQALIASEAARMTDDLQALEIDTRNRSAGAVVPLTAFLTPEAMLRAAQLLNQHRQALARHLAPDYAEASTAEESRLAALHLWIESWLLACRLNRLTASSMNAEFSRQQALAGCKQYHANLIRSKTQTGAASTPPESFLLNFLIVMLQTPTHASTPLSDDLIQSAEAALLPSGTSTDSGVRAQAWIQLSLEVWLECLARQQDFQAMVHFCTRFVYSSYGQIESLTQVAYRQLGYAWWDYARQVTEAGYHNIAWQQAVHSFMLAQCVPPLELLAVP